ncbi:MAG: hypothetical protein RLZZ387_2915 [Chloroflexota bacterium]|jgi:DNA-binding NarL/FixJ family response regulator
MIRVLIVDDHPLARAGIEQLVEANPQITLVGSVESGERAIAACTSLRPDVVLMDYQMPGMDGLRAAREIRRQDPAVAVVLFTTVVDQRLVVEAAQAGVSRVLAKAARARLLLDAIQAATQDRS